MKRVFKILFIGVVVIFTLLMLVILTYGVDNYSNLKGRVDSRIQTVVDDYIEEKEFMGSIIVSKDENIIYEKSTFKETNQQYMVASLTKLITATAIAQFEDQNIISINDYLSKYMNVPSAWNRIKIKHLLTHSSGLTNYTFAHLNNHEDLNYQEIKDYITQEVSPKEQIDKVAKLKLSYVPGEQQDYQNINYLLLGKLIEKLSGTSYQEYIQKNIFDPANMHNTTFEKSTAPYLMPPNINGEHQVSQSTFTEYSYGGLISTTDDFLKFTNALHSELYFKFRPSPDIYKKIYEERGYGWKIHDYLNQDKLRSHAGDLLGYSSHVMILKGGYTIIVLSNNQNDIIQTQLGNFGTIKYVAEYLIHGNAHDLTAHIVAAILKEKLWFWDRLTI